MQDQNTERNQSTQRQAAVIRSAHGVSMALRYSSGTIPAPMLDALITLGRTTYETLSATEISSRLSEATAIRQEIQAELDRLDKELAEALSSDDGEKG